MMLNQHPAESAVIYTCPMHPEVRQTGPGACPKCGMALEPLVATRTADTTELDDMTRRFWISVALSLPLLVISMSGLLAGAASGWLQTLLATPVVLWAGWPLLFRAWVSYRSWLLSVVALLRPTLLPETFKLHGMAPLYFEDAAVIPTTLR